MVNSPATLFDPLEVTLVRFRLAESARSLLEAALHGGGTYGDLFLEHASTQHLACFCSNQRRATPKFNEHIQRRTGLGIRVLHDLEMGFASVDDHRIESWRHTANQAALPLPSRASSIISPIPTPAGYKPQLPADAPDMVTINECKHLLQATVDAALSFEPALKSIRATYIGQTRHTLLINTEGINHPQSVTSVGLRVDVTLDGPDQPASGYAIGGSPGGLGHFLLHPPEHLARQAVEQARNGARARAITQGTYPTIFAPGWGGLWLHETFGHLLEADLVRNKHHPFAQQLGQKITCAEVTLIDHGTFPSGRGSAPFDDEGTPAQTTPLIDKGYLHNWLTDRHSTAYLSHPLTGNGRRQDFRHPPLPRMTNLLLQPGTIAPRSAPGRGTGRCLCDRPSAWLLKYTDEYTHP